MWYRTSQGIGGGVFPKQQNQNQELEARRQKVVQPAVDGPPDNTQESKDANDPYATGITATRAGYDARNADPDLTAWYNTSLESQMESARHAPNVHPNSPPEDRYKVDSPQAPTQINDAEPMLVKHDEKYPLGKGSPALDNPNKPSTMTLQ